MKKTRAISKRAFNPLKDWDAPDVVNYFRNDGEGIIDEYAPYAPDPFRPILKAPARTYNYIFGQNKKEELIKQLLTSILNTFDMLEKKEELVNKILPILLISPFPVDRGAVRTKIINIIKEHDLSEFDKEHDLSEFDADKIYDRIDGKIIKPIISNDESGSKYRPNANQTQPVPSTSPSPSPPRVSNIQAAISAIAATLKSLAYLPQDFTIDPVNPWPANGPFDVAFRSFVDAVTGNTDMSTGKSSWTAIAASLGEAPTVSGAAHFVEAHKASVQSKSASPAATTNPAVAVVPPAATEQPETTRGQDVLADWLSAMRNDKFIGTKGVDLVNEKKRINVLIEAAGNVYNAAALIRQKDPTLIPPKVPVSYQMPLQEEYVRRNKDLFFAIQAAVNAICADAFGKSLGVSLMPHNQDKAVAKLRAKLMADKAAAEAQNVRASSGKVPQWVKLATAQRKDRIRSEIAVEMTAQDRIAARKTKARESV